MADNCPAALRRVLVTGGQGFLGAYILRELLRLGAEDVALMDLRDAPGILQQVLSEGEHLSVRKIFGDVCDSAVVRDVVLAMKPSAIIHLAGLQIPLVKANPVLGAAVNVTGTLNIFEAVRALAESSGAPPVPVVYASSAAVLGPTSDYASSVALPAERDYHKPKTLYGVYKLANEGTARIYWQDYAVPSVGLRPLTIFGVGREVGLTSAPTKAVKAAVLGQPFNCTFKGVSGFQYVVDIARIFIDSAVAVHTGAHVCGIRGHVVTAEEFLKTAAEVLPAVGKLVTMAPDAASVLIHGDVDEAPLKALLGRDELHTPMAVAVKEMIGDYEGLSARGALSDHDLKPPPPPPAKL